MHVTLPEAEFKFPLEHLFCLFVAVNTFSIYIKL